MHAEVARADAVAQAALVRSRQVKPSELVVAAIERIEAANDALNAVIHPAFERAVDHARSLDEAHSDFDDDSPPLVGVPFLMKDLGGQEAGAPYHMGVQAMRDASWTESSDSYLAQRLRAAGIVSLGRTNTPELGLLPITEPRAYGPTRNPWNLERSPGGSSGGASAAVAAGLVPAAHASDGGGSIRIPAAHSGLVGLKPTRGRSSFGPAAGERWAGFSCELVVSRSVRDTAAFLDIIHGAMPGDPYSAAPPARPYASQIGLPVRPLRIGLMKSTPGHRLPLHPECVHAVDATAQALADLGHTVEEHHPAALDDEGNVLHFAVIIACNVARTLESIGTRLGRTLTRDDVEPLTWALAEHAAEVTATRYLASIEAVHELGRRTAAWWQLGYDLLLTPVSSQPPPEIGSLVPSEATPLEDWARAGVHSCFTSAFNMTGQPAISLPVHLTADGLPIGAQLVADTGREDLLLRIAAQLEQALPWKDRRPVGFF